MELKDATNLIRGEKGTDVVLTIKSQSQMLYMTTLSIVTLLQSKIFHIMVWSIHQLDILE